MMKKIIDLRNNNRFVLTVGGFLVLAMLLLLVASPFRNKTKTTGGEYSPNNNVAYFTNSTELYNHLGSDRFTSLQKDLRAHFNTLVTKFDQPINFSVKTVTKNDDSLSVVGSYSQKVGMTTFTVKLLNNDQMDVTAVTGKISSHDALPSNSKTSRFIASLPIYDKDYDINYLPVDKSIVVTLYSRDTTLIDRVRASIQQSIGSDKIDSAPITYLFPPDPKAQESDSGIADEGNQGD